MPVPDTSGVPPFADFEMIKSKINEIVQKYNNLLVSLDTLNVVKLNAKVVEAGTITGDKIAANTISADKMDVDELSAISANLGHITAGLIEAIQIISSQIYGSYFATSQSSYPKVVIDPSSNYVQVYTDALNYLQLVPGFFGSVVTEYYTSGVLVGRIGPSGSVLSVTGSGLFIQVDDDIELYPNTGYVKVGNWGKLKNADSGNTLDYELSTKANAFSGVTGSYSTGTDTLNFTNGILTSVT